MELYVQNRDEWHNWLDQNHSTVQGIWLIYYKKLSGKPRIPYDEAVEEALCFGWIDGKIKRVNDDYYKQWFTPRRPHSRWSALNMTRAQKLIREGRMKPAGLSEFEKIRNKPDTPYDIKSETHMVIPDDLINALKNRPVAYNNFVSFPPSSRKLYIFWLNDAKKAETRENRIKRIVDQAEKNMKPGF